MNTIRISLKRPIILEVSRFDGGTFSTKVNAIEGFETEDGGMNGSTLAVVKAFVADKDRVFEWSVGKYIGISEVDCYMKSDTSPEGNRAARAEFTVAYADLSNWVGVLVVIPNDNIDGVQVYTHDD